MWRKVKIPNWDFFRIKYSTLSEVITKCAKFLLYFKRFIGEIMTPKLFRYQWVK